jgi:hypothetical protein
MSTDAEQLLKILNMVLRDPTLLSMSSDDEAHKNKLLTVLYRMACFMAPCGASETLSVIFNKLVDTNVKDSIKIKIANSFQSKLRAFHNMIDLHKTSTHYPRIITRDRSLTPFYIKAMMTFCMLSGTYPFLRNTIPNGFNQELISNKRVSMFGNMFDGRDTEDFLGALRTIDSFEIKDVVIADYRQLLMDYYSLY